MWEEDVPQKKVDEDSDGQEGSTAAWMTTQEEDEVAEEAEKHHPNHVQLEEQVESVKTACYRTQVFQERGQTWEKGNTALKIIFFLT